MAGQLRLSFAAVAPVAIGSVLLSRFDLWPTALVVVAVAATLAGRLRLGSGVLGAAITAKLFPAVLLPIMIVNAWRLRGRREALVCLAICLAVVAVVFAPFVVLSPGGVWHSVSIQLRRPLQIESLGSALLLAAHHTWGHGLQVETSYGSQNLAGHGAHVLGLVATSLQAAAIALVWWLFARGRATGERLVQACAGSLTAFVAFGKVLSPQFLIWLVPLVPLVRGRRGLAASTLLAASLVLTQLWFPFRYWQLATDFQPLASWLVLARDLALVAIAIILVVPVRERVPVRRLDSAAAPS